MKLVDSKLDPDTSLLQNKPTMMKVDPHPFRRCQTKTRSSDAFSSFAPLHEIFLAQTYVDAWYKTFCNARNKERKGITKRNIRALECPYSSAPMYQNLKRDYADLPT